MIIIFGIKLVTVHGQTNTDPIRVNILQKGLSHQARQRVVGI